MKVLTCLLTLALVAAINPRYSDAGPITMDDELLESVALGGMTRVDRWWMGAGLEPVSITFQVSLLDIPSPDANLPFTDGVLDLCAAHVANHLCLESGGLSPSTALQESPGGLEAPLTRSVPEPGVALLLGTALLGLAARHRRSSRHRGSVSTGVAVR
jgi:hypothetical protein